jgi:hypothetical protein
MFMFCDDQQSAALAHLWNGGSCFRNELAAKAWTCGENGTVRVGRHQVEASKLTEMAVMICQTCPVQYDCARYAVTYEEAAGTWAMRRRNLEWLLNYETKAALRMSSTEAIAIIDAAEHAGVPVEIHVGAVRAAKRAVVTSSA